MKTTIETITVTRPMKVIAFTCCFITTFLMVAVCATTEWAVSDGWREGLFEQCVAVDAPTPLPFNQTLPAGCFRAHDAGYLRATAALVIIVIFTDFFGTLLTGLGLRSTDPNKKYKYYRVASWSLVLCTLALIIALILFPIMFYKEVSLDKRGAIYDGGRTAPNFGDDDFDNDGIHNLIDLDGDNDGIPNTRDNDWDNDGLPNNRDDDDDNDGKTDEEEKEYYKYLAENYPNALPKADSDNDGIIDLIDQDDDNDGTIDILDQDDDGDGISDAEEAQDTDGDGIPNDLDDDDDNDGIVDAKDVDDDGDGISDAAEMAANMDSDGDGISNALDMDDDNDGIADNLEEKDSDGDGVPDSIDLDDDNDGTLDVNDDDDDGDGIEDEKDIEGRAREYWFGFGYGASWASFILIFMSVVLLICDRESEEIFYKERQVEDDDEEEEEE